MKSCSREPSASTVLMAPVPNATGWGRSIRSIRTWCCRIGGLSISAGAIAPWRNGRGTSRSAERASHCLRPPGGISPGHAAGQIEAQTFTGLARRRPRWLSRPVGTAGARIRGGRNDRRAESLESFRGAVACPACGGARLRAEARSVLLAGQPIQNIVALTVERARTFFAGLEFPAELRPIATPLLHEILSRLEFLDKVGLPYLTLDRSADSLSGGELQRIRLATGIGSGLVGVCYVLDEPSIGLHPPTTAD